MKKLASNKLIKKISTEWNKLDFPTRALLLIGLLLLFELVYSVLVENTVREGNYDAVFRTSLTSIFGYIFGMNIDIKRLSESNLSEDQKEPIKTEEDNKIKQHFSIGQKAIVLRVVYATTVCVICIVTLILAQHLQTYTYVEGLLQVRNLISLTIGFLLSQANNS